MKLAVTAKGPHPESPVDECLGRARWLLIYDLNDGSWEAIDNTLNRNAREGAGKACVNFLVDLGAEVVISGEAGPKAFRCLNLCGAKLYYCQSGSAETAVQAWRDGQLAEASMPNEAGNPYCLMGHKCYAEHGFCIKAQQRDRQTINIAKL